MENDKLIRIHLIIRIVLIIVMLLIGIAVIYNKFGYEDKDDVKMVYDLGEITKTITCRQALYYYAENELRIFEKRNQSWEDSYNLQNFSITLEALSN